MSLRLTIIQIPMDLSSLNQHPALDGLPSLASLWTFTRSTILFTSRSRRFIFRGHFVVFSSLGNHKRQSSTCCVVVSFGVSRGPNLVTRFPLFRKPISNGSLCTEFSEAVPALRSHYHLIRRLFGSALRQSDIAQIRIA
jgi:hypothetical protein